MRIAHIILLGTLTFCWLWLLPMLCVGFVMCIPFALVLLPTCVVISFTLQYVHHGKIFAKSRLRNAVSSIPWNEWFPCNTIHVRQPCVVAVHPHGVICCGALAGIHFVPGSETVFAVAPLLFYVPILGWILRLLGCVPARFPIMLKALRKGYPVIVMPGGVPELVMSEEQNDSKLFLKRRRGFLRLASLTKTSVLCVTVSGECNTYRRILAPCLQQRIYISWRTNVPLTLPIFAGWYGTWLPKRTPLRIETRLFKNPTKTDYEAHVIRMLV